VVYVAFYGTRVKIGMSAQMRVRKRCIEQGADAFSRIVRTSNRYEARRIEKEISRKLSLRQSFSVQEILRMTTSKIDYHAIDYVFDDLLGKLKVFRNIEPEALVLLKNYPITFPLRSLSRETTTPGLHLGKIRGIKGRLLFYESGGLNALNISDIPSRRIRFN